MYLVIEKNQQIPILDLCLTRPGIEHTIYHPQRNLILLSSMYMDVNKNNWYAFQNDNIFHKGGHLGFEIRTKNKWSKELITWSILYSLGVNNILYYAYWFWWSSWISDLNSNKYKIQVAVLDKAGSFFSHEYWGEGWGA